MRRSDSRLQHLAALDLLDTLSTKQLRSLAMHTDETPVAAGATLIREGMLNRHAYFVVSGSLEVLVGDRRVATLGPGSVAGERAALRRTLANATVRAAADSTILAVHHQALLAAVAEDPDLRSRLVDVVDERDRELAA